MSSSFRKRSAAPRLANPDSHSSSTPPLLPLVVESYNGSKSHNKKTTRATTTRRSCCGVSKCLYLGLVGVGILLGGLGVASLFVPRRQLLDFKLYLDQFLFVLEDAGLLGEPVRGFRTEEFYLRHYPALQILEDNVHTIQQEWRAVQSSLTDLTPAAHVVGFKKKAFQYEHTHWRILTFKLGGEFIPQNLHLAPRTAAWLKQVPGVDSATFSIFEPHTYLPPHWGYWKGYVRYQLALQVPSSEKCWIRMVPGAYKTAARSDLINHQNFSIMEQPGHVTYSWKEGEGVLFDDVSVHDAWNDSDQVRVVLYLDLARKLPMVLDVMNKILLWFINHSPQIERMKQMAPIVVTSTPENPPAPDSTAKDS